jgi:hypothetical protein
MGTIDKLLDMSDGDFKKVVNDDVRDEVNESISKALRSPDLVYRWHDTLLSLKRSAESQFSAHRAEKYEKRCQLSDHDFFEWLAIKERWRSANVRFKNGVEDKIQESKRLIQDYELEEDEETW